MVLEQQQRPVGRCGGERFCQRAKPRFAQDAGVIGRVFVQRIQRDDGRGVERCARPAQSR